MKATLHRDTLVKCSERILPFIDKKPVTPIFGCYLLRFEPGWLHLTAASGNTQVTVWCSINCQDEMRLCVDGIKFHELIKQFTDPEVKVSIKGSGANGSIQKLVIKGGNGKHELPITDPVNFPVINNPKPKSYASIDAQTLVTAWNVISPLVNGKDQYTPQMAGIHIAAHKETPGRLSFEGGTSFRSAVVTVPVSPESWSSWTSVIIEKDVTSRAKDVFDLTQSIEIIHDGQRCTFTGGGAIISTRSIEGKFAGVSSMTARVQKSIAAHPSKGAVTFSSGEFLEAIKRLRVHKTEGVSTMTMGINGSILNMTFINPDTATEGNEDVAISGNPSTMTLGVHIDILEECIRAAASPSIEFSYCDPKTYYIITPLHGIDFGHSITMVLGSSSTKE